MKNALAIILTLCLILVSSSFAWAAMDMSGDMTESKEPAKKKEMKAKQKSTQTEKPMKEKDEEMGKDENSYQLKPIVPKTIKNGEPVTIKLRVLKGDRPVDGLEPHLMIESFFAGHSEGEEKNSEMEEDMEEEEEERGSSEAGGKDEEMEMGEEKGELDLKGTPSGSGEYRFKWTPDSDGRFNLTFMLKDSQMEMEDAEEEDSDHAAKNSEPARSDEIMVPVDVKPTAPNPYALGSFGAFVVATLSYSTLLRRQKRSGVLLDESA